MKNWDKIINECYKKLYKLSEPSVDFDILLENATINQFGQKEIPYNDYEICVKTYEDILNTIIRKYRLNEHEAQKVKNTIAWGCSPKFKKINEKYV